MPVSPLKKTFAAVLVTLFLAGCSTTDATAPSASVRTTNSNPANAQGGDVPAATATPQPDVPQQQVAEGTSFVVTSATSEIEIWDGPGGAVVSTLSAADVLTVPDVTPLVFLVKSQTADWYEVYLPVRPNGSTGWVRASQVTVSGTQYAIDVYLADHTLVLAKSGVEVARFAIGVGASDKPTPGGVYYLRELLQPPDPTDVYGVYAYGLSGFSPVLDSFRGGDAVIGLHGTNDPASIGQDVSHGCLRMNNADITALVETYQLPLGTPIHIHD